MSDYAEIRLQPEERLHLIEENVQDYAIFVIGLDGRIASWNLGAERILGYTEQEAIGLHCRALFTPEDRARGAVEAEEKTARDNGRAVDERWHLRKDGSRFWGNGIMTALREAEGDLRGYAKIMRDETKRKSAEDAYRQAQEERFVQERRNAVLEERNRLAQEIHDTLTQSMTAIHLQLEALKDLCTADGDLARSRIEKLQEVARQGIVEIRRSVRALRPLPLERYTLAEAFVRMADEIQGVGSLEVVCMVQGTPITLPSQSEDHLLRIGQEASTNVLRHAQATQLELLLRFDPDTLTLEIRDNGRGFDPQQRDEGFGLIGLRERVGSMGGRLTLESAPGQGTSIAVTLPLNSPSD